MLFRFKRDLGVQFAERFKKPTAALICFFCSILQFVVEERENHGKTGSKDLDFDEQRKMYNTHLTSHTVWLTIAGERWGCVQDQLFLRAFKNSEKADWRQEKVEFQAKARGNLDGWEHIDDEIPNRGDPNEAGGQERAAREPERDNRGSRRDRERYGGHNNDRGSYREHGDERTRDSREGSGRNDPRDERNNRDTGNYREFNVPDDYQWDLPERRGPGPEGNQIYDRVSGDYRPEDGPITHIDRERQGSIEQDESNFGDDYDDQGNARTSPKRRERENSFVKTYGQATRHTKVTKFLAPHIFFFPLLIPSSSYLTAFFPSRTTFKTTIILMLLV
ncbi:unnamed protein product [Rhizoctonia solani]|uniref:DUF6532 domain-containing protein n=1 Tax=Rhizoctonia solani TaxID=456999 RepID=A0A8H3DJ83_9AGAM|nr:unnamed protein product [Rhizoctonia solani]